MSFLIWSRICIPSKSPGRLGFEFCSQQIEKVTPGTLQNTKHSFKWNKINEISWKVMKIQSLQNEKTQPHFPGGISIWCPMQNEKHAKLFLQERLQNLATPFKSPPWPTFALCKGWMLFIQKNAKIHVPNCWILQGKPNSCFAKWKTSAFFGQPSKIKSTHLLDLARLNAVHSKWILGLARASKQTQTLAKCRTFHKMRTVALKSQG